MVEQQFQVRVVWLEHPVVQGLGVVGVGAGFMAILVMMKMQNAMMMKSMIELMNRP